MSCQGWIVLVDIPYEGYSVPDDPLPVYADRDEAQRAAEAITEQWKREDGEGRVFEVRLP